MKTVIFGIVIFCLSKVSDCDASAGTSSASSGLGVRVTALLHERVGFEARAHTHLSHWCNATIPAQEQRRNALYHLLSQAQLLQTSESVTSAALSALKAEVASLDKDIAEARLSAITTQSLHAKEKSLSHLSLEDATKDVDALQHTLNHLGVASAPTNAAVKAAASLLAQAEESKHQLQKQVVLLQDGVDTGGNLSRVLVSYTRKKAELAANQQQYFTTQRSLDVLTSALEDESEYLADLHSICSAESSVHKRLEKQMSQSLSHKSVIVPTLSARPAATQPVVSVAAKSPAALPSGSKREEKTSEPAALKQKAKSTAKSIIKAKIVAKKTAMLQDASKARAHAHAQITAKRVAKALVVDTHAKARPRAITKDPFEDDDDAEVASASSDRSATIKSKVAAKVAPILQQTTNTRQNAVELVHPKAGAKMKDPFADDDDDDTEASLSVKPEPSTKLTSPIHRQSLAAQSKSVNKAHSQVVAKMKDPFADDDDDDDETPPSAKPKVATKLAPVLRQASKSVSSKVELVHVAAGAKVKDPFADDDDDDDDAAASPAKSKVRAKPAPILEQTSKSGPKSNPAHLPEKMKDPFADDDDDDDDDDELAPAAKSKRALQKDPILQQTAKGPVVVTTQSQLGEKMKDPFADDDDGDDAGHHETPVVAKKSHSIVALQEGNHGNAFEAKADANDNDLDAMDSEDDTASSMKGGAAVASMKQELDVDEAIAEPTPERTPTQSQQSKAFIGKVVESSPNALPTQYSAWTPTAKATSDQKRKAALAEMGGDLEDDDDEPKPIVARKARHHTAHAPPPPSPPPPRAPSSDGVVYDDDDLPKHRNVVRRLEGGWEAFMKKDARAARAPKLDPDVAIMESLYGKDGSLPTQYTAWTPDDVPKPAPQPAAHVNSKDDDDTQGETMDLEAAAKAFAKDPDSAFSFLQIAQDSDRSIVDDIISRAAATPASFRGSTVFLDLSLEASTAKTDLSRMAVATTVLAQYAEVLQSRPLKQLSKAKLNPQKLRALFQQLSNVDPLSAKTSSQARGKQAQAEKMCNYLQAHMQAAAPVQKALVQLQKADNDLTIVLASQVAIEEEVEARTQLEKTVAQDVSNLIALKSSGKQRSDSLPSVKGLTVATAADVGASFANIEGANAEVQDLLDAVLQKRQAVLKTQRQKLSQLQVDTKHIVAEVAKNTKTSTASQAEMEAIRKKLTSLSTSCGATLNALARRRHNGHMEAHAIEVALKVLGNQ